MAGKRKKLVNIFVYEFFYGQGESSLPVLWGALLRGSLSVAVIRRRCLGRRSRVSFDRCLLGCRLGGCSHFGPLLLDDCFNARLCHKFCGVRAGAGLILRNHNCGNAAVFIGYLLCNGRALLQRRGLYGNQLPDALGGKRTLLAGGQAAVLADHAPVVDVAALSGDRSFREIL